MHDHTQNFPLGLALPFSNDMVSHVLKKTHSKGKEKESKEKIRTHFHCHDQIPLPLKASTCVPPNWSCINCESCNPQTQIQTPTS